MRSTFFEELPEGALFICLNGGFAQAHLQRCYLGPETLFLKRSNLVVVAFSNEGLDSFPVGSDYGNVSVVRIPFPLIVRKSDEDLLGALALLKRPY